MDRSLDVAGLAGFISDIASSSVRSMAFVREKASGSDNDGSPLPLPPFIPPFPLLLALLLPLVP